MKIKKDKHLKIAVLFCCSQPPDTEVCMKTMFPKGALFSQKYQTDILFREIFWVCFFLAFKTNLLIYFDVYYFPNNVL